MARLQTAADHAARGRRGDDPARACRQCHHGTTGTTRPSPRVLAVLAGVPRDVTWFTPTFAMLIAVGEVAIGVALLVGGFTGVVVLVCATLNLSLMFAESAGVNPAVVPAQVVLVAGVADQVAADHRPDTAAQPWAVIPDGSVTPRHA